STPEGRQLSVSAQVEAVRDRAHGLRPLAAAALARTEPKTKPAVPPLTSPLGASNSRTRLEAAHALAHPGRDTRPALPAAQAELKSTVATRQASALLPLSRFGISSSLLAAPPCQQAGEALAQMGPAARAAVPALSEALNDRRLSSYRPYYALALLKIDGHAAR